MTSTAVSVAAPRARPRINLPDAPLRTNPQLRLIPFAGLSQEERGELGKLTDDPTCTAPCSTSMARSRSSTLSRRRSSSRCGNRRAWWTISRRMRPASCGSSSTVCWRSRPHPGSSSRQPRLRRRLRSSFTTATEDEDSPSVPGGAAICARARHRGCSAPLGAPLLLWPATRLAALARPPLVSSGGRAVPRNRIAGTPRTQAPAFVASGHARASKRRLVPLAQSGRTQRPVERGSVQALHQPTPGIGARRIRGISGRRGEGRRRGVQGRQRCDLPPAT